MASLPFVSEYLETLPFSARVLTVIGFFAAARPLYHLIKVLLDCYVYPGIPLSRFGPNKKDPSQASWALITGATDGIGKEFALQLASKGFNIVIASRTQSKLDQVKADIVTKGVAVKTVAIDFNKATEDDYARLGAAINDVPLSILVNNVGLSHNMPVAFADTSIEELESIAEVNVRATLRVTRLAVPILKANPRGLILNLGSFAGSVPTPLLTTYAGTKSFLIGFNRALNEELKRVGITSLLLNTYFVQTSMSKIRKSSWSVPTPSQYVSQVLSKLGRPGSAYQEDRKGREMTIWPQHALTEWAVREFVGLGRATKMSYKSQAVIRSKAIKRQQKIESEGKKGN
ncbi:unnamed protein product [Sympodiomycopsis kandeliae]